MNRFTVFLAGLCMLFSCVGAFAEPIVTIAFYRGTGIFIAARAVNEQSTPELAARLLLAGPTSEESSQDITSAIPRGTRLNSIEIDCENKVHIDLSREYLVSGNDDAQIEAMGRQWFTTFSQFTDIAGVIITIDGQQLTSMLKPTAALSETRPRIVGAATLGLAGKSIVLSPGHGRYWNGSSWYYQRATYCGYEEEDLRNLKLAIYLKKYLENHGAIVYVARDLNMNDGGSPYEGGRPWWQMASPYWLKQQGYPSSVYANSSGDSNLGSGINELNDDIRARPLMSDYLNADIYVSIHTNGSSGYCTGAGCPSGSETYYDASSEHAAWGAISQQLANKINPGVVYAINAAVPEISPNWSCHGACVKDSGGSYGEIRIPDRAATLTELGFHDTCDRDAIYMNDSFFRSAAMWGMYKGICEYFSDTPSPMYNAQYISDDIPATVTQGETRTVHITLKNKGLVWSSAKGFKLGAVGNSDPFASTRQSVSGEISPSDTCTFTFNMTFPNSGIQTTDWQMVRNDTTWFGDVLTKTVNVLPSDSQPPSTPANLRVTAATTQSIALAWDPSTDNKAVTGYRVYRNSDIINTTTAATYTDTGLTANQSYSYRVQAYDAVPNYSAISSLLSVMTPLGTFSIEDCKNYPNGTCVATSGTVSAVFNGYFYIQQIDCLSGLKVVSSANVQIGNYAEVTGPIQSVDGERFIDAATVR